MKKLILCTMCFILFFCSAAYANELHFKPVGGGKFIYCNNPEGIEDDMILNGENPRWIMNNENLSPDNYYIYLSHFNYTGNGSAGYDIELDMEMTAKENSKITIHKAFFETPQTYAYYQNASKSVVETDWGQLQVCADMLGIPMCDIRGEDFYYPREFEPVTLELKQGDSVWLSVFFSHYEPITFGKGVHIQAFVEIESGLMDFNVGAIKSDGLSGQREHLPDNAEFGEYRWDYTLKGIADTLPEVTADIEYTIDESTSNGDRIPVFLKNQYIPEGHTVTEWYTQLNPQNDIWSKTTAAESDILPLYYKDNAKLDFYGTNVDDAAKDNVWQFDTAHSAVRGYEQRFGTGEAKDFMPNFILSTDTDNHTYACNIGNYGVATTYRMSVTNDTDMPKYCSLVITAASEIIAYETNSDGVRSYAYVKDLTSEKVTDNMLSHKIPPNSTEEFEFSLILPVNYNGGIKNELVITDENIQTVDFEEKKAKTEEERNQTDYRITDEIYGEYMSDIYPLLPEQTASQINRGGYEYLKGKDTALVRWCAWDGVPAWYYHLWGYVNTVYMLDSEYNIVDSHTFPSLPYAASYNGEYFYIKTAQHGTYKSTDGTNWVQTSEPIPEYVPYYDLANASEWAVPELEKGWNEGIRLTWYGSSYNFRHGISREDFCRLAASLLDKKGLAQNIIGVAMFDDTSNPDIERLASIGIINGFGDGTFRPEDQLTREQAAVILARLAEYICSESEISIAVTDKKHVYADSEYISDWASDGVSFVYNIRVMHGVGNNTFEPQGSYSREQSAITMLRLCEIFN